MVWRFDAASSDELCTVVLTPIDNRAFIYLDDVVDIDPSKVVDIGR